MNLMGGIYWEECQYSTIGNGVGFGEVAGPVYQSHLLKKSGGNGKAAIERRNA